MSRGGEAGHGREAVRAARRIRWRERLLRAGAPLLELMRPGPSWTEGALILLYHRVHDDARDHGPSGDPFSVGRAAFEAHVDYLAERFRLVTVGQIATALREGHAVAGLAAVSFDDGYECTFRNAWPVLRGRNAPATLFVDTGRLDGPRPALSRDELRSMAREGLELGSHTVSHGMVTRWTDRRLQEELRRSAADLAEILGHPPRGFAYPFGRYDARAVEMVREAGYDFACTCRQDRTNRPGDDPFRLRRTEINQGDAGRRFARKVAGRVAPVYAVVERLRSHSTTDASDER